MIPVTVASYDMQTDHITVHRSIKSGKWEVFFFIKGTDTKGNYVESETSMTFTGSLSFVMEEALENFKDILSNPDYVISIIKKGGFRIRYTMGKK